MSFSNTYETIVLKLRSMQTALRARRAGIWACSRPTPAKAAALRLAATDTPAKL